jgi:hypothetical protein
MIHNIRSFQMWMYVIECVKNNFLRFVYKNINSLSFGFGQIFYPLQVFFIVLFLLEMVLSQSESSEPVSTNVAVPRTRSNKYYFTGSRSEISVVDPDPSCYCGKFWILYINFLELLTNTSSHGKEIRLQQLHQ